MAEEKVEVVNELTFDADIAEVEGFLATSKRPLVKELVGRVLADLQRRKQRAAAAAERKRKEAEEAEKAAAAEAAAALAAEAAAAEAPKGDSKATSVPKPTVGRLGYATISSYAWDQSDKFVSVYISLDGVGALPKEKVECTFTKTSFDLIVNGLNGVNHRLHVTTLSKEIDPRKSKIKVKKDRVVVMLSKVDQMSTWFEFVSKKGKTDKPMDSKFDKSNPTAGIMDMMRDMYATGDDDMKKTIAEAWTKSASERGRTRPEF